MLIDRFTLCCSPVTVLQWRWTWLQWQTKYHYQWATVSALGPTEPSRSHSTASEVSLRWLCQGAEFLPQSWSLGWTMVLHNWQRCEMGILWRPNLYMCRLAYLNTPKKKKSAPSKLGRRFQNVVQLLRLEGSRSTSLGNGLIRKFIFYSSVNRKEVCGIWHFNCW